MTKNVLDKGFIRLVEFMGGDIGAVRSARVSLGSDSKGEARDKKLIEYLLGHNHLSPFEHSVFQFHVKCPIFVARQWMRHRWCSYNEISARYTEVSDEFHIPDEFRIQDTLNKQGSKKAGLSTTKNSGKNFQKSSRRPIPHTRTCFPPEWPAKWQEWSFRSASTHSSIGP